MSQPELSRKEKDETYLELPHDVHPEGGIPGCAECAKEWNAPTVCADCYGLISADGTGHSRASCTD